MAIAVTLQLAAQLFVPEPANTSGTCEGPRCKSRATHELYNGYANVTFAVCVDHIVWAVNLRPSDSLFFPSKDPPNHANCRCKP